MSARICPEALPAVTVAACGPSIPRERLTGEAPRATADGVTPVARDPELPATFRALFDSQAVYVSQVLRRFGVAERDLDDAVQEVFVAVHARFVELDPARPVRPWLMAFAFYVASNYRRLARHRYEVHPPDLPEPSTDGGASRREARSVLLRALDELPLVRRDVFVLHDIEGLDAPQVAELLGIPVNTVYSRLRVARTELEAITRRLVEEPR